eukprot:scaffold44711_cov90-Cyclotella_meneghiniana.AAC.3
MNKFNSFTLNVPIKHYTLSILAEGESGGGGGGGGGLLLLDLEVQLTFRRPVLIAQRLFQYFEDIGGNEIADIT